MRKNEGNYTEHCRFYMWEVGGGCLAKDPITMCPPNSTNCPGAGEKPEPGKLCHQARPDCSAYQPTLMFSCGEGGLD